VNIAEAHYCYRRLNIADLRPAAAKCFTGVNLNTNQYWDEALPPEMLPAPPAPLTNQEMATLWSMFVAVDTHWTLGYSVDLMRSRWLDMLKARGSGSPDFRGEYLNAAKVPPKSAPVRSAAINL